MDFKKIFEQFTWKTEKKYEFSISSTNEDNINYYVPDKNLENNKNIYPNISDNLNYIKYRFNSMINSDIIIREFVFYIKNKEYKAFLLFIDGMINSNLLNDFILKPLMSGYNNKNEVISEIKNNSVIIRKIKKINVDDYILKALLPQNSVSSESKFDNIITGVNSGNCALFIDTINVAYNIEVKGFEKRSVNAPNNEVVIMGPQEAFVENIRTNTSLLRRIVNTEKLVIENIEIGSITKTKCAICYVENIANDDLIGEVRYRLNNLQIDSLMSSGQLEQLIVNDNPLGVPEILQTERPDKASKYLLQGRVIVLVNGSPYSLIMPAILIDFMSSSEDTNLKPYFGNFLKILRLLSAIITLLLPRNVYCND